MRLKISDRRLAGVRCASRWLPAGVTGLVSLQADSFVNRVLFAVYRKQQDQMSEIADLVKPKG